MPGKPITIGPFSAGLNNISTSGEAEDNEVVQLMNLEVNRDTSLTSRPPIQTVEGSTLPSTNTLGWDILGVYRFSMTEWYLIAVVPTDGTTNTNTTVKAYLNGIVGPGESVSVIKNSVGLDNKVTCMVQFKNDLYFAVGASASDSGFSWTKGQATGGTAISSMPKGNIMIGWKSRLWITGETKVGANPVQYDRVYFSTINSSGPLPNTWGASDFFDVAPGEGGFNTALLASFNNLIIFKTDGTWRFSFPSSPAQGIVEKLSGQVGAANSNCAVEYENYIFVYDQGIIYELINSNFTQINRFVKFDENAISVDASAPGVDLTILNRRLIVRYLNSIFVYTIDTKSWSQWFSYNGTPGRFFELPTDSSDATPRSFIAASKGTLQSASANYIANPEFDDPVVNEARAAAVGGTVTYTTIDGIQYLRLSKGSGDIAYTYLNRTGSALEYDIPVAPGQKFNLSATINETVGAGQVGFRITYLCSDNTVVTQDADVGATGAYSNEHIVPAKAVLANVSVYIDSLSSVARIVFSTPNFNRKSGTPPQSLLLLTDVYDFAVGAKEYIDCWFETKSYDYQAAPAFKRMFYWGADLKTPRSFIAEARPVSTRTPVTWGDLENYTWEQLEQGTWGNPLDWLNKTTTVTDYTAAQEEISDNGRFFVKILKAMRFRQISFYMRFSTFGTLETGPVKLFSLTTMVSPKQDVVDKIS